MNIYEKLLAIQDELKAPKDLDNKFGNYKYRSAEKIFEALKPLCTKHKAVVFVTDEIIEKRDKLFVEATATLVDVEMQGETFAVAVKASAEIPEGRKGMDASQVSGASSSYARKYALNGLFAIDDNKDSDVPPALPDSREDFERYADKIYGEKEKKQAIKNNDEKMKENENYRIIDPNNVEIRTSKGMVNLDNLTIAELEKALTYPPLKDVQYFIQARIDLKKGSK